MAQGYIQTFLQFPNAKNGSLYVYMANSTNLAKALASPILPILLLFMRKDEVPTPKHFTVPLVFKTRLNPIQLPFHLPNHRCDIGLSYKRGRL